MAIFNSKGRISAMSEITKGTGSNGKEWQRMTLLIEFPSYQDRTDHILFNVGTTRIDDVLAFAVGDSVEIGWAVNAREYQGRWFNNLDLISIKKEGETEQVSSETIDRRRGALDKVRQAQVIATKPGELEPQEEDLPF